MLNDNTVESFVGVMPLAIVEGITHLLPVDSH